MSAADLFASLELRERQADLTTVYRVLDRLVSSGFAHQIGADFYPCSDRKNTVDQHHFLICKMCGEAEEIFLNYQSSIAEQLKQEKGFALHHVDMRFSGLCRTCAQEIST